MNCLWSNTELVLGLAGIIGTLVGGFIGAYFSYRSINKQFSQSIKRMRIERTFVAYEQLLEIIIEAQSLLFVTVGSERQRISPILVLPEVFNSWYSRFQPLWHQKQYLLDNESLAGCTKLAEFIAKFLQQHPQFVTNQLPENYPTGPTPEFVASVVASHSEFLQLLQVARSPLQDFLTRRIEKQ